MIDWNSKISPLVQSIAPSGIREFFDIVAGRADCISLGVGEPDFITPQPVINEAIASLRKGHTHYTGNSGLLSLRKAVAGYLKSEYDLDYDPESQILITVGVSEAIDLALRSLGGGNANVLYAEPGYVSYSPMISLAGANPIVTATHFSEGFQLHRDLLEEAVQKAGRISALLINNPCNPTGVVLSPETIRDIADFALDQDALVLSDEIYGELTFDSNHIPMAGIPGMYERTLTLGGFSKSFAMTGWRIGYAAGPSRWIAAMTKIHQYSIMCAPTIGQVAAEAALRLGLPDRDRMRVAYRMRRDRITELLREAGLEVIRPGGAFYVFPRLPVGKMSSMEFARSFLDAENVAVVPGSAFGTSGEGHFRASFATGSDEIETAMQRLQRYISAIIR